MSSVQDLQLSNLTDLIIGQYNDAETLQTLTDEILKVIQDEQVDVLKEIQDSVNLDNAGTFFLDVMGNNFGYQRPLIDGVIADDVFYLKLIKAFILGLFFDDMSQSVNKVLKAAYANGFLSDNFNMTSTLVIERGDLTTQAISDIIATGLPIRPAGKRYDAITVPTDGCLFGFDGIGKGFDQAPYAVDLGTLK